MIHPTSTTAATALKQITWRRINGTLTPMYRTEMGPWLRCDRHGAYQRSEYEITSGMTVWTQLQRQGCSVVKSEDV